MADRIASVPLLNLDSPSVDMIVAHGEINALSSIRRAAHKVKWSLQDSLRQYALPAVW
jgi:hypothetical protein